MKGKWSIGKIIGLVIAITCYFKVNLWYVYFN